MKDKVFIKIDRAEGFLHLFEREPRWKCVTKALTEKEARALIKQLTDLLPWLVMNDKRRKEVR